MIMCPVADGADNQSVNASGPGRTAVEQASPSGVNLAMRPALPPAAAGRPPFRWSSAWGSRRGAASEHARPDERPPSILESFALPQVLQTTLPFTRLLREH